MTTPEMTQSPDPMFAIFDGSREITEEMYQEVRDFADYVKEQQNK